MAQGRAVAMSDVVAVTLMRFTMHVIDIRTVSRSLHGTGCDG